MLQRTVYVLSAAALLVAAHAGVAYGQDDDDDWDALVGDEGSDDLRTDSGDNASDDEFGGGLTGGYPTAFVYRPRTLPKGAFQIGVDLTFNTDFTAVGIGSVDPANAAPGGVAFSIGVTNTVEFGASYGFALNDPADEVGLKIKGVLSVFGAYRWISDEKKQIVPFLAFGYSPRLESAGPINAGVLIQYDLVDRLATFFRPALVVLPDLGLGAEPARPVSIDVPAALGYQITGRFYAELNTRLARIKIANQESGFFIADFLPVGLTAMYTALGSQLDIGATLNVDLRPPEESMAEIGDTLVLGVLVRWRGGL